MKGFISDQNLALPKTGYQIVSEMGSKVILTLLPIISSTLTTEWKSVDDYEVTRRWSVDGGTMCQDTGSCCPDSGRVSN